MITWQFEGSVTHVRDILGLAPLYPIGTAISLEVTFDTAAPRQGLHVNCDSPQGLYRPFVSSALELAGGTHSSGADSGWAAINHHFDRGCLGPGAIPEIGIA